VQQQVANHQYECMKAHKKSCEKKVLKAYIKAQKKHKKVNNDDLKDREKRRKRCLEKAKLKCEKKVIMQMTRKFDSKTMKLIKTNQKKEQLLKQIVPWQKEQKEKKTGKHKYSGKGERWQTGSADESNPAVTE